MRISGSLRCACATAPLAPYRPAGAFRIPRASGSRSGAIAAGCCWSTRDSGMASAPASTRVQRTSWNMACRAVSGWISHRSTSGFPGTPLHKDNAPPYMVSMGWMFHDMVSAIREGREGSPSFAEAAHVQRVVEAVLIADRERRWVRVDEST